MTIECLYKDYGDELEHTMTRFCQNRELAKDSRQHSFLKGFINKEQLEQMPEKAAKAWIFATARNHIIDQLRKQKRLFYTDETHWFEGEGSYDYEKVEFKNLVSSLPSPKKEIVVLRYYSGFNSIQIAQSLIMEPATVRYHLSQALKMLKEKLT